MIPPALAAVRRQLDDLDQELVALLARREGLVRQAGALKTSSTAVRDPARVERVVSRAVTLAAELGASSQVVERTYRAMIAAFVDLELRQHSGGRPGAPEPASPADAGEILTLQRAAFISEAQLYDDPHLPALVQSLQDLRSELEAATVLLKVTLGARIVGAVRAQVRADVLHVGRLVVAPDWQRQGLGAALLAATEAAAPADVRAVQLFTGARSNANLRLYQRCGYAVIRREQGCNGIGLVHLSKPPAS